MNFAACTIAFDGYEKSSPKDMQEKWKHSNKVQMLLSNKKWKSITQGEICCVTL